MGSYSKCRQGKGHDQLVSPGSGYGEGTERSSRPTGVSSNREYKGLARTRLRTPNQNSPGVNSVPQYKGSLSEKSSRANTGLEGAGNKSSVRAETDGDLRVVNLGSSDAI